MKNIESEIETHPPPTITACLGNSSKLNASSEVIANSYNIDKKEEEKKRQGKQIQLISDLTIILYNQ